ncbi:MAG: PD-(D/E)XK nuclease family protein [Nitrospirae bacterium]|nr:PD-(D/E)XK nuclease family protein [Nitrospirota bacterium]
MPYSVFLGAFHPNLENAFVQRLRQVRRECGPIAPLVIVTPSRHLLERLQWVLAREGHWLALHFCTLHGLALRILEDATGVPAPPPSALMLREIIRAHLRTVGGPLAGLAELQAGPDSVASTLRDLQEGRVDPRLAHLWLEEQSNASAGRKMEITEMGELTHASELMAFFTDLSDSLLRKNLVTEANLAEMSIEHVPRSGFLARAAWIFYYGFYDLTQIQTDLFHTIASNHAVDAFIPIAVAPKRRARPSYEYANRYFESFLRGLAREITICSDPDPSPLSGLHARLFDLPTGEASPDDAFHVVSVSGGEDEVRTAAKWILRAHEEQGTPFSEIGLVARNWGGYWSRLRRILGEHGIPFTTPEQKPAAEHRLIQTLLALPNFMLDGFRRGAVIELLSSPYVRVPDSIRREPAIWDYASRLAGITTPESWEARLGHLATKISEDSEDELGPAVPRKSIETLLHMVKTLRKAVESLTTGSAPWADHARRLKEIVSTLLITPPAGESPTEEENSIMDQFTTVLGELEMLDGILPAVTADEFYRGLDHALRSIELPAGPPRSDGVKILTAMSARGYAFDLLILLGMNSKGFPRAVEEDPLLRDRSRGLITRRARKEIEKLGHYMRLAEKIAGHEEDRLLLSLLANAARRQMVVLYQRSDDDGAPALASPFVHELQQAAAGGLAPRQEIRLPRPDRQKTNFERSPVADLWTGSFTTPREIAVAGAAVSRPVETLDTFLEYPVEALVRSLGAMKMIESWTVPGAYDGRVRPADPPAIMNSPGGFSPSLLERYVSCPFRFFSERVLDLEPWPDVEEDDWPTPMLLGNFVHSVLARFGRWVDQSGLLRGKVTDWRPAFSKTFDEAIEEFASEPGRGYPTVWEARTGAIRNLLLDRIIPADLERLSTLGADRLLVERKASTLLDLETEGVERHVRLTGRVDRMALLGPHQAPHAVEVIDWKFKTSKTDGFLKSCWQNAARGRNLQPPLYALLAGEILRQEGIQPPADVRTTLVPIGPRLEGDPFRLEAFTNEDWSGERGERLTSLLAGIVHRIHAGDFQLRPAGSHSPCDRCEYRIMCRRDHPPSRRRAEHGATFGWLETVARTDKPESEKKPARTTLSKTRKAKSPS